MKNCLSVPKDRADSAPFGWYCFYRPTHSLHVLCSYSVRPRNTHTFLIAYVSPYRVHSRLTYRARSTVGFSTRPLEHVEFTLITVRQSQSRNGGFFHLELKRIYMVRAAIIRIRFWYALPLCRPKTISTENKKIILNVYAYFTLKIRVENDQNDFIAQNKIGFSIFSRLNKNIWNFITIMYRDINNSI